MKQLKRLRELWRLNKRGIKRVAFLLFLVWYIFALPSELFNDPKSKVILSEDGELLGAHIAPDGQWRFQERKTIPYKIKVCTIYFEDKNFENHFGVSITGVSRALYQNLTQGEVVSGGSTITQQVIRMHRKNPRRTYFEKIKEMLLATRLEWRLSKSEILALYVSHAPYGNNVVGLDAASWRYFGRKPEALSWAESATLAVLPNAPGLIYPGKNHESLIKKRNRLLYKLYKEKKIDRISYAISIQEPLPEKPLPLPNHALHLLHSRKVKSDGKTSIHFKTQQMVTNELEKELYSLQANSIRNAAALVIDNSNGKVVAYIGNATLDDSLAANQVDCIQAPRSTGSILKPILYEKALKEGIICPESLLPDVPSRFGSFSPTNYNGNYEGAVSAKVALAHSLNIPFVHLLQKYGFQKFKSDLERNGFHHVNRSAKHYGLTLILGGGEATLWEIASYYSKNAQLLNNGSSVDLTCLSESTASSKTKKSKGSKDLAAIYSTFETMVEVNRPGEDGAWRAFSSSQKIAWKTGTSFGFRDAWCVGVTPKYTVAVWVGNADGEGRPGLTGIQAAAPILFSIFKRLPTSKKWFNVPFSGMQNRKICRMSGMPATSLCEKTKWSYIPSSCESATSCPYHILIHTDQSEKHRVTEQDIPTYEMKHRVWFTLPLLMEKYYKIRHADYKLLPPYLNQNSKKLEIEMIYPRPDASFTFSSSQTEIVSEVVCTNPKTIIHWHLDEEYLGTTETIHQMVVKPKKGKHEFVLVSQDGQRLIQKFEVK